MGKRVGTNERRRDRMTMFDSVLFVAGMLAVCCAWVFIIALFMGDVCRMWRDLW